MPCTDKAVVLKSGRRRRTAKAKDEARFNCPFPGCDRSCAELWRLKVHFRAPPDNKGSGIERGHNAELEQCPRCLQKLETGKHHVGCRSGLAAPRQALKREGRAQDARSRERLRQEQPRNSSGLTRTMTTADSGVPTSGELQPDGTARMGHLGAVSARGTFQAAAAPLTESFASLGGAIHLYRAPGEQAATTSSAPAELMTKPPRVPACTITGPGVLLPFLDCEMDDEVVIPRSFAPALSRGVNAYSPLPPQLSPGTMPLPLFIAQPLQTAPSLIGNLHGSPRASAETWGLRS